MHPFGDIKYRATESQKTRSRDIEILDLIDLNLGDFRDYERIGIYDVNYDLFNGRLDVSLYDDPVCLNIEGEKVKLEYQAITHYPLISQVAQAMYGEVISRPFRPIAKDLGSFSQSLRNKKWNELIRELIQAQILAPLEDEITTQYMRQNQIRDIYKLSPEEVQQMQSDIQNRLIAKTPGEIVDFMQNDFQTPTQRQAQQLLDYFVSHEDIKWKQEEGFKHAIITGKEIYYVGERNDEPVFDLVNPKYFQWAGSQNTEWFEDGLWAKNEQWLTLQEAEQRYASKLRNSDLKKLEGYLEPIGGANRKIGDPNTDRVQKMWMLEMSEENGILARKYSDVDYKTREGQGRIANAYRDVIKKYGENYGYAFANYGVRESHIAWRDKRKLRRVTTIENGKEVKRWYDEHYEPRNEDIKVVDVWVDEIRQGTILGSGPDNVYVDVGAIPGQFKSVFNPFGTKLPYFGRNYNTHMNNARNVSIIDLGKPWQKEFDVTMAQLKHTLAMDWGSVLLMTFDMKPDNLKWQQWWDIMRNGNLLLTNPKKHGISVDPDLLRSIDLSKAANIANTLQLLNYFRENLVTSMNFNPSRIGAIGQYATNQNIQQSNAASYNQTEGYFETHRKIVERALNAFMNRARILYKNNHKRFFILDDVARTELEISPDFWYEEWAIEFRTTTDEIRKVEELRAQMLSFVQNGMSFDGVLALALAETPSDIIGTIKKENRRLEELRQEQLQIQQQQFQAQIEAQAREKQLDRESKLQEKRETNASMESRTVLQADSLRRQADADMDMQSDVLEKTIMELQVKKLLEEKKLALMEKELQIKEKSLNSKGSNVK